MTACDPSVAASTQVGIAFTEDGEAWTGTIEVHILPEGTEEAAATFPGLISTLEEQARIAGVDAAVDWQVGEIDSDGNTIYSVEINGETLAELNALLYSEPAFTTRIVDDEVRWYFQLDPQNLIPDAISNWQFSLSGREIITGNGESVNNTSMLWSDAHSDMTAVMVAANPQNSVWPVLFIALCIAVIIATFLHQRGFWHFPDWISKKIFPK